MNYFAHNSGSLICKYICITTIDLYELNPNANHYLQNQLLKVKEDFTDCYLSDKSRSSFHTELYSPTELHERLWYYSSPSSLPKKNGLILMEFEDNL